MRSKHRKCDRIQPGAAPPRRAPEHRRCDGIEPGVKRQRNSGNSTSDKPQAPERGDGTKTCRGVRLPRAPAHVPSPLSGVWPVSAVLIPELCCASLRALFRRASGTWLEQRAIGVRSSGRLRKLRAVGVAIRCHCLTDASASQRNAALRHGAAPASARMYPAEPPPDH